MDDLSQRRQFRIISADAPEEDRLISASADSSESSAPTRQRRTGSGWHCTTRASLWRCYRPKTGAGSSTRSARCGGSSSEKPVPGASSHCNEPRRDPAAISRRPLRGFLCRPHRNGVPLKLHSCIGTGVELIDIDLCRVLPPEIAVAASCAMEWHRILCHIGVLELRPSH